VQELGHGGADWLPIPLQYTAVKSPQSFASTVASHALSSGTPETVPQTFDTHVGMPREPVHVAASSQVVTIAPPQSDGTTQQSPWSQQKPLPQWPVVQSPSRVHVPPSG